MSQGQVWWANLPDPAGSEAGFRRPVVVAQGDRFNRSRLATAVCVPLTSNLRLAEAPGNVLLPARSTGLPQDSVASVSLILAVNKYQLVECVGQISDRQLQQLFVGIDMVLGRA
ncbi:MAG: type II toxin-antitoxin system PemK/MazF family toxin [bacterium]|nr:type II toxin-antitoxin system PemK/MazF family toxin [bacterium]